MRAVGLKVLKNKLSEYVRLAASGETVLVTDRDKVVAELVPPRAGRSTLLADARLAEAVRRGWLVPAVLPPGEAPPRAPVASFDALMEELGTGSRRVIYLDTSVALVQLLTEDRTPPSSLWEEPLVSSRLLEYELWTRINSRGLTRSHGEAVRALLGRVSLLELAPPVLARALDPFPIALRTLDALHLASIEFLRDQGQKMELASYDDRLGAAADALRIARVDLSAG